MTPDPPQLTAAWLVIYFSAGGFTAASYALLMEQAPRAIAAVAFSTLVGATNACESWVGWTSGRLVAAFGYPAALFAAVGITGLGLLFLAAMPASHASRPYVEGQP